MSETSSSAWSIKRLLEWTTEYFQKVDADSPRLEAEVLLAEALSCARIELYTRFDDVPPADSVAHFRDWVKRRGAGEPVAYIVGHREFYSLKFAVDSNVLIPRPETEHLIVAALEAAKEFTESSLRIIDVGTGSGCIAVTLAKYLPDSKIAALDLSPAAIAITNQNAETHGVASRIRFFTGDLFAALPAGSGAVHMIVSNPPYIGTAEIDTVDDSVKNFEPEMALFAGPNGTEVIARLISESASRLLPGGLLIFESSPINMAACRRMVDDADDLEFVRIVKYFAGLNRVLVARRT